MEEKERLFFHEYEAFYRMAAKSDVFGEFCKKAFGEDFSQDGFSDIRQIDRILEYVPGKGQVHILDIGCGNGKMLGYLQKKTGAFIHGFDYSGQAIQTAKQSYPEQSDFKRGIIGEIEYPEQSFELIVSMDTMYFADDMTAFVGQIFRWLRAGGVFFCAYQEGEVMPKTDNVDTTELAKAFRKNEIDFEVTDITGECYELLKRKREAAISLKEVFLQAGEEEWYRMLLMQTECVLEPFEIFREKMARYLFTAKKQEAQQEA